jgi:hypothetical protein
LPFLFEKFCDQERKRKKGREKRERKTIDCSDVMESGGS